MLRRPSVLWCGLRAFARDLQEDESSMLQMPIMENTLEASDDTSDCRCPGYIQEECEAEAEYGCVWTDAGSSNAPWCQCREILEPGWIAPPRPVDFPVHVSPILEYQATMGPYPGYVGDLEFTGSVSVDQAGDNLLLSWHLSGLEAQLCAVPPVGVGNACGIHIHSGLSCDDPSQVGGHYYHDNMAADPWSPVVYTPDASGASTSSGNSIAIGQSLSDVLGRAIVVHDHTGGRVACGIIQTPVQSSPPTSVQSSWDNHFAAFGGQDVDRILLDYSEQSVITVYDQTTGSKDVFSGLAGVQECFEGLFANLFDLSDLAAPVITVREATADEPGSVFLIWSAPASGYSEATDTFIFDSSSKILWQNVVVSYRDPRVAGAITRVDDMEVPTGSGAVHDGWANHFAAFGGQDVDQILLDYVEQSEITVYNSADGSSTIFSGLDGVRECFVGLFANLFDTSDLSAPIVHVDEATPTKAGQVFLIWAAPASGYRTATDTFLFNMEGKITRQHVVVHYWPSEYEATMGSYPGYSGNLQFTGSVSVEQAGDNLLLSWHLSGLEAQLCAVAPAGVANACGIHIHSGSSCDDPSLVGGHYFHANMDADPWSPVVYTPDASGASTSAGNSIAIGQSLSDVLGRAIVVHDHTGGRVACGIIMPTEMGCDALAIKGNDGNGIVSAGAPDGASRIQFIDLGAGAFENSGEILSASYHMSRGLQAALKFQIYRPKQGNTYTLVSETDAMVSDENGSIVHQTFATPLQFQPGDYIGWVHSGRGTFPFVNQGGSVRWQYGIGDVGSDISFQGSGPRVYAYEITYTAC